MCAGRVWLVSAWVKGAIPAASNAPCPGRSVVWVRLHVGEALQRRLLDRIIKNYDTYFFWNKRSTKVIRITLTRFLKVLHRTRRKMKIPIRVGWTWNSELVSMLNNGILASISEEFYVNRFKQFRIHLNNNNCLFVMTSSFTFSLDLVVLFWKSPQSQ